MELADLAAFGISDPFIYRSLATLLCGDGRKEGRAARNFRTLFCGFYSHILAFFPHTFTTFLSSPYLIMKSSLGFVFVIVSGKLLTLLHSSKDASKQHNESVSGYAES